MYRAYLKDDTFDHFAVFLALLFGLSLQLFVHLSSAYHILQCNITEWRSFIPPKHFLFLSFKCATQTSLMENILWHTHTLSRTTLVGFFRISVSGLASDFLDGSADWTEKRDWLYYLPKNNIQRLQGCWMEQLNVCNDRLYCMLLFLPANIRDQS